MKKLYWILFGIVVTGAGLVLVGPDAYRHWRQEHLVKLANNFLQKGDQANAALCLRRAVQSDPKDVRACRLYAMLAERAASPNALWWRHRVVDLEPKVLQNRIDWAKTALALGDLGAAQEALGTVDENGKKTLEYHLTAGALAWARNNHRGAEGHCLEALKLDPTNASVRLNLAIAQLVVDSGAKAESARATLDSLRTNPAVQLEALRQLTQDALRNNQPQRAVQFAQELQADRDCRFSDRVLYLEVLQQAHLPELAERAAGLQAMAATNSAQAYEMLNWRIRQGEAKGGLAWAESLAGAVRTNLPLPVMMSEAYANVRDWASLNEMTEKQNWRELEYLRHLVRSLALRSQQRALEAAVEWRSALTSASKRLDHLNDLAQRTATWSWDSELNETLWAIVENFPMEKNAFLILYDRLVASGNTPALHNLLSRISSIVDLPLELKNNFAVVSLLVYPRGQHGHDLAHEAYEKNPENPYVASTYAFSLYLQQKGQEALRLLEGLPRQALETPSIAAYYGIILAGTGDTARARPYLERGLEAKLLPEEKALISKAERGM